MKFFLLKLLLAFHRWRLAVWSGRVAENYIVEPAGIGQLHRVTRKAGYYMASAMKTYHFDRVQEISRVVARDEYAAGWADAVKKGCEP